jgi:hypothetical protein
MFYCVSGDEAMSAIISPVNKFQFGQATVFHRLALYAYATPERTQNTVMVCFALVIFSAVLNLQLAQASGACHMPPAMSALVR